MASGGISRSGRVRKKSAKLMEMEDWDAFDLNDAPAKGKKRPRSDEMPEFETPEKKVAPLKIPKATKVPAISPVKRRVMDDMIHLKNLQNIQESGYLNVPAAPKTVQVPQHQPMYPSSAVVDDSSSSSSESSESSSEDDSDSDDSMEYGRPMQHLQLQQKAKKPAFQMIPQAKAPPASAMDFEAASQHARQRGLHHLDPSSDMIDVEESDDDDDDDDDDDTRDSHLVIAEEERRPPPPPPKRGGGHGGHGGHGAAPARSKAPAAPRAPKLSPAQRAKKMSTNDDPEYEEPVPKKAAKKTPAPKAPPKPKPPPKEKAKTRPMTAYMLWCQENRRRIVSDNPGMDFATISKKLGETWQMLPDKDKIAWRRKAKVPASKGSTLISTGRPGTTSASAGAPTGASSTPAAASHGGRGVGGAATAAAKSAAAAAAHDDARAIAAAGADGPKSLGIGPVDVAAHLKLLGESLSTIGQRLTEHEGQIAVSGSLSVLLDSTLCALGPLLCLTSLGKEMNGCSKETLTKILNNIAYVMPGL